MNSKPKVKMVLVKLDPLPEKRRKNKRNNVEHGIEHDGKDDVNEIGLSPSRKKKKE